MSQETIIAYTEVSFKDFLFKNKRNRTILWFAAVAIVIQFAVFKYFYPFASFIHGDSFSYLKAADQNLIINTYMIGYSKFLRLFSVFAKSDYILVAFQYLFLQLSSLFLLFTIFIFYKVSKATEIILLCFMTLNPLYLHLANLISSDGFFLAISFTWFTLLLWIINRPSNKLILWHAIVLLIAFTIRYNAMIYPFIAAVAFFLSKLTIRQKITGFGLSIMLCVMFIGYTMYLYKSLTGYWQYSPFSGWQLANNAMYTYRYVNKANRKPVPKNFQRLDQMVREYFDSTRDTKRFFIEKLQASTFYMWSPGLPLMKYRDNLYKADTSATELKKWASMGPIYKSYGIYIIKEYPMHFLQYFVWPNTSKYYAPPIEFLEHYNSGRSDVSKQAKEWFGYKSKTIKTRFDNNKVRILDFYPILSGIINVSMAFLFLCYLFLKGWQYNIICYKGLLLGSILWFFNAGFTIFASSAALRFQAFPVFLTAIYVTLILDWMAQLMKDFKWHKIKDQNQVKHLAASKLSIEQ